MAIHPKTKAKSVFEFDYLVSEGTASGITNDKVDEKKVTEISAKAFNYLKEVSLKEGEETIKCLKLVKRFGVEMLQVQNYVGVLFAPNGEHIEVLPKVGKNQTDSGDSRETLWRMLRALGTFRHVKTNQASIAARKMPLLDVFIDQFLSSVNLLIKRGLRSDYINKTDNLNYCKGKLLIDKQIKHNFVNQHKFYVQYDKYLINRPANRLIKAALMRIKSYLRRASHQCLLNEFLFMFDGVPVSKSVKQDFTALKMGRGMKEYEEPIAWAKLILDGFSPLSMQGESKAFSLLFPMEAVFESYVAAELRKQLVEGAILKTQAKSEYLVKYKNNGKTHYKFQLKPDLLIENENSRIVLDTKWKVINRDKPKDNLSQSDFYQMFAYGHKYLASKGDLILIYPKHDDFQEPIAHSFDFNDDLRLWVCSFDIAKDGKHRLKLPTKLPTNAKLNFLKPPPNDIK